MSIRTKIISVLLSILVLLSLGIYISSNIFIFGYIKDQDIKDSQKTIELTSNLIKRELSSLDALCGDWSAWDDSYDFIETKNPEFIATNLVDETFKTAKINLIIFINSNKEIVYEKAYDYKNSAQINISDNLIQQILKSDYILNHSKTDSIVSGIIMHDNYPIMFSSQPITNSEENMKTNGTLIMAKFFDTDTINLISKFTKSVVQLRSIDEKDHYANKNYQTISYNYDYEIYSKAETDGLNEVAVIMKDIFNKDSFILKFYFERTSYLLATYSLRVFLTSLSILMFFVFIFALFTSNKVFLSRIKKLNRFVNDVIINPNTSDRITLPGTDEISNLANRLNQMLDVLESSKAELVENERRLTLVMEGSSDGFWDLNLYSKKLYLSKRFVSMLNYGDRENILNMKHAFKTYIFSEDLKAVLHDFNRNKNKKDYAFNKEIRILSNSGLWLWMQAKGKVVEWDENNYPLRLSGTIADITERRKYENHIRYMSYHDILTGLYNRAYYMEELSKMNTEDYLPLSLVLGDVNGLKLTNDTFGHLAGDNLLIKLSRILEKFTGVKGFVARLGGDEFILVLPNTTEITADQICKEIWNECHAQQEELLMLSISLGFATKNAPEEDIQKVFEIAEDRMYKNKLLEDTSSRHSLIASMERSLLETDYETEEHALRLQELSIRLAEHLKLPANAYDELSLLSRLHDIGKIAIPQEILLKTTCLTNEEWEIIKQHPEIGYRIAASSNDLAPIADSILCHHEKWDGSGYPKGLKGTNIPLYARIIAIIDAYDVITHSRPYKKAATHDEAIAEVKRCSGSHFDPELAKAFIEMFDQETMGGTS